MFKFLLITSIALNAYVFSASSLTKTQKFFYANGIDPDILNGPPRDSLQVKFPNGAMVDNINILTPTQVKDEPMVTWNAHPNAYYTLIYFHQDIVSRWNPTRRPYKMWSVINIPVFNVRLEKPNLWSVINIPGCNVEKGDAIYGWTSAGPVEGTGYHRYVFLVYQQRARIEYDLPFVRSDSPTNRASTNILDYAQSLGLCSQPDFGNFFQATYDSYSPIAYQVAGDTYPGPQTNSTK